MTKNKDDIIGKVLKIWRAHGFECRAVNNPLLTINGYVGVPKDHPYSGESYWDFGVDVHGGVTYADFGKTGDETFPHPELYWIGWDTLHLGDYIPHDRRPYGKRWNLEDVVAETTQLAKQLRQVANGERTKRDITDEEAKDLLKKLKYAIDNLEGVKIPFNIIKQQIQPLREWLDAQS